MINLLQKYFKKYWISWVLMAIVGTMVTLLNIYNETDTGFAVVTFLLFGFVIFGITHVRGYRYALSGVWKIIRHESSFVLELFIGFFVVLLGIYFNITSIEWVIIVFTITLVLVTEAINSTVEAMSDAIIEKKDTKIAYAKDVAAGAVLITGVCAFFIGFLVFWPYIEVSLGWS